MKENFLSTREVADLLSVTEMTIKRWTGSGRLKCVKTLGGHRKYKLNDIEAFARENELPISGTISPLRKDQVEKIGFALFSKNLSIARDVIMEEALQGDRDGVFELLLYLSKNRIKFAEIVDQIIQPAMDRIGDLWEKQQLAIEQEHLATDTIKNALSRLGVYLPRQKKKGIKVICACCEGENHDLGIQALGYYLELSGYSLHYLGANTPFQSLISSVNSERPDYLFLSATAPSISRKSFVAGVNAVAKSAAKMNSKFVIGGRYSQNFNAQILKCDIIVNTIKESVSFIHKSNQ